MSKISFLKLKDALIAETYNDDSLSDGDINFEVDDNEIINVNFVYYRDKKFGSEFNKYKHNFQYLIDYFGTDEYIKKRLLYEVKKDIENIYWSRRKYEYSK